MKKSIYLFILVTSITVSAQSARFGVVSNLKYSPSASRVSIDSMISRFNSEALNEFIVLTGQITSSGTKKEFESLSNYLDSMKTNYLFLPNAGDTRDAEGWEWFMNYFEGDNFAIDGGDFIYIGINPTLPYRGINYYHSGSLNWLSEILEIAGLQKEVYFFSPVEFESVYNWQSIYTLLQQKNLKLIINGNRPKFIQRNLLGTNIIDLPPFDNEKNSEAYIFRLSRDSITVSDSNQNSQIVIDKSIQINKELPPPIVAVQEKINLSCGIDLKNLSYSIPIYWNGKVYSTQKNGLVTCHDSTGNFLWDYDTFGEIIGTPVIKDRILAIATLQGDLITLSAISGEQIQTIGFEELITTGLEVIDYSGTKILMIPKLTESKAAIVFGTASGRIYCYDLETLQEYWVYNSNGMIRTDPVTAGNKILFAGSDGFIYSIDARNGLMIWRWKEKAETDFSGSRISADGKSVFAVSHDGIIYAIDQMLGKLEWKNDKLDLFDGISVSANRKSIYVKGKNSIIYQLNPENGKITKEFKQSETFTGPGAGIFQDNGNLIYTENGKILRTLNGTKSEILYQSGYDPFKSLKQIGSNRYMASGYNGRVIIFSMEKN